MQRPFYPMIKRASTQSLHCGLAKCLKMVQRHLALGSQSPQNDPVAVSVSPPGRFLCVVETMADICRLRGDGTYSSSNKFLKYRAFLSLRVTNYEQDKSFRWTTRPEERANLSSSLTM